MEKLTKHIDGLQDACPESHDGHMISMADIVNRLAAYEDTGLTPEEIKALKADKNRLSSECILHQETVIKQSAEIDTLKKALELACDAFDYTPNGHTLMDYYIQQAQEQEGQK